MCTIWWMVSTKFDVVTTKACQITSLPQLRPKLNKFDLQLKCWASNACEAVDLRGGASEATMRRFNRMRSGL